MISTELEIINRLGLHARAAAKFVNKASEFSASVSISKDGRQVNGKSIMGVMMLAASKGSMITLNVEGEDEEQTTEALRTLINNRFDEDE